MVSLSHVFVAAAQQNENLKICAFDTEPGDIFGDAVAIHGNVVIVGAPRDDDAGSESGSAYLFNATTGQELFKLLAADGSPGDWFGHSVGISGNVAIVGAPRDDDAGGNGNSGSAYLFDVTTGAQLNKLVPSDTFEGDWFGCAVSIDGPVAIIGAKLDDNVGDDDAGSAYLFAVNSGQQLQKLVASDRATNDEFGYSVAIEGNLAVVGSHFDDDLGGSSGSAYVFDVTTGQELSKLTASDGAGNDRFGQSVAISGEVAAVGMDNGGVAYTFDAPSGVELQKFSIANSIGPAVAIDGNNLLVGATDYYDESADIWGASFLFDIVSGEQRNILTASESTSGSFFGWAVAIQNGNAVVSARGDQLVYVFEIETDTDGDGLLDSWETDGIPVEGSEVPYELEGADPLRKDIYVEVDAMVGLAPNAAVRQMIIDAFANAPVVNPDSSTGITFHFQLDETDLPPEPWTLDLDTNNDGFLDWVSGFDAAMADHFGSPDEQGYAAILEAKRKAYRYCIFGHSYDPDGSSGLANGLPGHLFMVTLGQWGTYGGTTEEQAGTFMHELGHCLGLGHGGDTNDHIHFKPNYYSVMNYSWQTPKSNYPGWRLDYSHAALPTLDELALNEAAGLGAEQGEFSGVFVPFNGPNGQVWLANMEGGLPIDWNVNGQIDQSAVQQDLNYLYFWQGSSPDQILQGHDDWSSLVYDFRGTPGYANGDFGGSTADSSFTYDMHLFLESIPAPGTGVVLQSVDVENGTYLDGDIPDVTKPDDAREHRVRSGFGPNIMNLRYTEASILGTAVNPSPTSIDLRVRSSVTLIGVTTQLRLRNWNTGSFDLVQSYAADTTPATHLVSDIDANQYVNQNGEVELSIKQIVDSPFAGHLAFTFDSLIDWVQITAK